MKVLARRSWSLAGLLALAAVAGQLPGCGPKQYRQQADKAAYGIIARTQKEVFGKSTPFTIQPPEQTLRRRLMLDQDLPYAGRASLGAGYLKPIPHWPEKNYPADPATQPSTRPATQPAGQAASQPVPPWQAGQPVKLSLTQALEVAARNSREYQNYKEAVFRAALSLDLEDNQFRSLFAGTAQSQFTDDLTGNKPVRGLTNHGNLSWTKQLKSGAAATAALGVDLVKLLTMDHASSLGLFADATVTVPLLQGAGNYIVAEPLTQAQRNVVYALFALQRYRRTLAVQVASGYLGVLQQLDQIHNAEENYRSLILSTRQSRRMAEAGRLPQIQVDQSVQDELTARNRWISAQEAYASQLDQFKMTLGLPTDAHIELERQVLTNLAALARQRLGQSQLPMAATLPGAAIKPAATTRLGAASEPGATTQPATSSQPAAMAQTGPASQPTPTTYPSATAPVVLVPASREGGGPLEMDPEKAIRVALANRLDLRTALGQVYDAQRHVVVAANGLLPGLSLALSGQAGQSRSLGSAGQPDAQIRLDRGLYNANLLLDLPLNRTAQRDAYRQSFIDLQQSVRSVQSLEDQIKFQVRNELRTLTEARESYTIQQQSVVLAKRRVESTQLFLQAGRAQVRDVLDAQNSLISAQNALTSALVNYRVAELELERDMGVLQVNEKGQWREYKPN